MKRMIDSIRVKRFAKNQLQRIISSIQSRRIISLTIKVVTRECHESKMNVRANESKNEKNQQIDIKKKLNVTIVTINQHCY